MDEANKSNEDLFFEFPSSSSIDLNGIIYGLVSFWFNGILNLCLVILGIAGNAALIGSFRYKIKQWLALYFYFFTFAIWNTGLLSATVLFNCLPGLFDSYSTKYPSIRITLQYSLFFGYLLGNTCMTAIVWLFVAVTVERYLAVTRPFHSRLSSPRRRAKIVSLLISAAAFIYNIPLIFEFSVGPPNSHRIPSNLPGSDSYSPSASYLRENQYYILIYRVLCNILFLYAAPCAVIVTLTVKILCTVSQSGQKRRLLKRSAANSIQETSRLAHLLLTFIVFKFLICYTLPVILNLLELLLDDSWTKSIAFAVIVDVSNFLVVGDSASNAFFYFSWRKRIRFYGLSVRKSGQPAATGSRRPSPMYGGELATAANSTVFIGGQISPAVRRHTAVELPIYDGQKNKLIENEMKSVV